MAGMSGSKILCNECIIAKESKYADCGRLTKLWEGEEMEEEDEQHKEVGDGYEAFKSVATRLPDTPPWQQQSPTFFSRSAKHVGSQHTVYYKKSCVLSDANRQYALHSQVADGADVLVIEQPQIHSCWGRSHMLSTHKLITRESTHKLT